MAEYIKLEDAITKLTDLDAIEPNATMVDAKRLLADMPSAKAVSLHDIYRVITGHSYYHGDCILAALTCIAEGKEVNPVYPADVAKVVRCENCVYWDDDPDTYGADNGPKGKCMKSFETMCADDFCSYGERKDEANES